MPSRRTERSLRAKADIRSTGNTGKRFAAGRTASGAAHPPGLPAAEKPLARPEKAVCREMLREKAVPAARRGKLSYKDQREYDTIEEEIDRLQAQSDDLAAQIQENATDFEKLAELSAKKDETDAEIDRKMERYLELQDMVDALRGDVR